MSVVESGCYATKKMARISAQKVRRDDAECIGWPSMATKMVHPFYFLIRNGNPAALDEGKEQCQSRPSVE